MERWDIASIKVDCSCHVSSLRTYCWSALSEKMVFLCLIGDKLLSKLQLNRGEGI